MLKWLPQVGSDTKTLVPLGRNLAMKSAPIRSDPVPERHWIVAHRFSLRAGEPSPRSSLAVAALKGANPSIGRYSLSLPAASIRRSASTTTGRTQGLSSSVR